MPCKLFKINDILGYRVYEIIFGFNGTSVFTKNTVRIHTQNQPFEHMADFRSNCRKVQSML